MKKIIIVRKVETVLGDNGELISIGFDVASMKKDLTEKYIVNDVSYSVVDGSVAVVFECSERVVREPRDNSNIQFLKTYK